MTDMMDKVEFGDFQTPIEFADEICRFLQDSGLRPSTVIEPTCGDGSFLIAAFRQFSGLKSALGYDINPHHLDIARRALAGNGYSVTLERQDFFSADWTKLLGETGECPLILGNLPWVTSSRLGTLNSGNLPEKTNFLGHTGFAAKTGKANFDISEWMLIKLLEASAARPVDIAILCKLATARKVLKYAWTHSCPIAAASLHTIDAEEHFGASVSACLLFLRIDPVAVPVPTANQYSGLSYKVITGQVGLAKSELVSDLKAYSTFAHLDGTERLRWRSGIKHDAAAVMELERHAGKYYNKLGQECDAESSHIFPMLKSSDLANGRTLPARFVIVTQFRVNEDTSQLRLSCPRLWTYLQANRSYLDSRKSSIYRNRPNFSIFGVGDYSFSQWKVAIAGLYKSFHFVKLGQYEDKPILVDDTCYFLSFNSEDDAASTLELLRSRPAQSFLQSLAFYDSKRPITIDVLKRLDLLKLSEHLGIKPPQVLSILPPLANKPEIQGVLSF